MKRLTKYALALAMLFTSTALAGCAQRQSQADQETGQPVTGYVADFGEDGMTIWKDPETGCEYIVWASYKKGGITARLNSDGSPRCRP